MGKFVIQGSKPLSGTIEPIGNKNAVLAMIPAALLTDEPVTLTNVPAISDVMSSLRIIERLGAHVSYDASLGTVTLVTKRIKNATVDPIEAKKFRASNLFLGPLLARHGNVSSVLPGGDKIGPREMNAHFDGFRQLGARVRSQGIDRVSLRGPMRGADVFLYEPSVTATENVILASVTSPGVTTINNAACEPHVQELCRMLMAMGASIEGIGTNFLRVTGVKKLHGATYAVPADYVYIGTMIVLSVVTGGELRIKHVVHEDLRTMLYFFGQLGVKTIADGADLVVPKEQRLIIQDIEWARTKGMYSQPWPCFPTDMMSLGIVLATQTKGSTLFFEKMYSGRMFFADFLNGMGANIIVADPHRVIVNGKTKLKGRTLFSSDLRAGMAYVAAGLAASGKTTVENIEHIDRGYPSMEKVLQQLGARIERHE